MSLNDRVYRRLITGMLLALSLWLAAYVLLSLRWRMAHDTPLLYYIAFLMNRYGLVPYVDIFTNQPPGALAFHALAGRLFGYGDLAFRLLDLTWLALISLLGWRLLRPLGRAAAWAGPLLFAISYLQLEQEVSFQRDFIGILPIALGTVLVAAPGQGARRRFAAGFCFGLAVTIKPHLGLGLPVLILYDLFDHRQGEVWRGWAREVASAALPYGLGLALPLAAMALWMWRLGAWPAYREINAVVLPLYLSLSGEHRTLAGANRLLYLWQEYAKLGGLGVWLAPASMSLYLAWALPGISQGQRRRVHLLAALAFTYSLYVLLGGKFWSYHWLPCQFFLMLVAAASLAAAPSWRLRWLPAALLALTVVLAFPPSHAFYGQLWGQPPRPPKGGRVDEIAAYLQIHLHPGDTVQQLDWTGGATHAMLIAEARMATPYMEDYIFYIRADHPYVQAQRRRLMETLQAAPPRFIIDVADSPRPSGPGTSSEFPELRVFIARKYAPAQAGAGYVIYERLAPATG